jgi:hypothetical protein
MSGELPKECPNCGLTNPASAEICDCGYNFLKKEVVHSHAPVDEPVISNFKWMIQRLVHAILMLLFLYACIGRLYDLVSWLFS